MKKITYRLLCLALALSLALALAACGKTGDAENVDSQNTEREGPDPTEDPRAFLEYNAKNTAQELEARWEGHPLSILPGLNADSGTLDVSLTREGKSGGLTASLCFDRKAGCMRLDAALKSGIINLSAAAYADGEFIGVSCSDLLSDDAFYGCAPTGLSEQAEGSPLAQLLGDDVLEILAQIDAVQEQMRSGPVPGREDLEDRCNQLADAVLAAADLTVESKTVDRDGVQSDGVVLTADMDGEDMKTVLDKFQELFPEFSTALEAAGEEQEDLRDLVSPDIRCRTEFVTDGCLISIIFTFNDTDGSEGAVTLSFFDQGGESLVISGPGGSMTVRSQVRSDETGWSHSLTADDGEVTASLTTEYRDSQLSVRFTSPEENVGLTCGLAATETGFTVDNVNVTADNVTRNIPVTVTYTPGASVSRPENTKNLFALSEQELTDLIATISVYL